MELRAMTLMQLRKQLHLTEIAYLACAPIKDKMLAKIDNIREELHYRENGYPV